jgi:hypothetical protein
MVTEINPKPDVLFTESPASWNTRYVTPEGYVCQITLRGENGKDLLEKAGIALAYLKEHNFLPDSGYRKNGNGNGNSDGKMCPVHGREMKRREKDGSVFYSHKTESGSWCYGKVRKNGGSHE